MAVEIALQFATDLGVQHAILETDSLVLVKALCEGVADDQGCGAGCEEAEVVSNKKAASVVKAKKLEEAAEPAALDRVSTEVKQLIQKARLEKKMSQAELAKQINERP
ncbi:multiprotein-bridging factor 1c [Quercus suber]|uniref:Multiprotein-bridging factor 1c n=1 Tax=Quercus suber TaxID=58331 RepID=A0AAW0MD43_QUESU